MPLLEEILCTSGLFSIKKLLCVCARDRGPYEVKNGPEQSEKRALRNSIACWHSETWMPANACPSFGPKFFCELEWFGQSRSIYLFMKPQFLAHKVQ